MGTYRNPIVPGFHPDPSIYRVGPAYCYMRPHYHAEIAIVRREGKTGLIARQQLGELQLEKIADLPATSEEIELSIITDAKWIDLGYVTPGGARRSMHRAEVRLLSTEVAGGFTGLYLALYAQARTESASLAHFNHFRYVATSP